MRLGYLAGGAVVLILGLALVGSIYQALTQSVPVEVSVSLALGSVFVVLGLLLIGYSMFADVPTETRVESPNPGP